MPLPCGRPDDAVKPRAKQLDRYQQRLREYLSSKSLKYTEQRWKIARLILATGEHLNAQDVVVAVSKKHPEIGAATVYRNLKVLCEAGILKESLNDSSGRMVYELDDEGHHDHIVCLDCGKIFEFHDRVIEDRQTKIAADLDFKPTRHRHVVYARCQWQRQ